MTNSFIKIVVTAGISAVMFFSATDSCTGQNKLSKKEKKERKALGKRFKAENYFIEGERFFIIDQFSKALPFFKKVLEIEPTNDAAHFKIAQSLIRTNKIEQAYPHAKLALNIDPKNKFYYLNLAYIQTELHEYPAAISTYEALIKNIENSDNYYYELASLYLFTKNIKQAIKTYEKILNVFGTNDQVVLQLQKLYIQNNQLNKALSAGQELIDKYPAVERYRIIQSEILLANNKVKLAKKYLEDYLRNYPNRPEAQMFLSTIYTRLNETSKSKKIVLRAFKNPSLSLETKLNYLSRLLGKPSQDSTRLEEKVLCQQIINSHPEEAVPYTLMGDLEYTTEDKKAALQNYLKALEFDKSNFSVWQNAINIQLENQQYLEVIDLSNEAIELFPNQGILYFFSGTASLIQKNYKPAIRSLEKSASLSSDNKRLLSIIQGQLGDSYNGVEQYVKSDSSYEEALKIDPDNEHVLNNYAYFLSLRKEKLNKAKDLSFKLVNKYPENPTYLDTYGWVLYQLGEYQEGLEAIEKAAENSKDPSGAILEHYGDLLYKTGKPEEALEKWQEAQKYDEVSDELIKKIQDKKLDE